MILKNSYTLAFMSGLICSLIKGTFWHFTILLFQELLNLPKIAKEDVEGYTAPDVVNSESGVEKPEVLLLFCFSSQVFDYYHESLVLKMIKTRTLTHYQGEYLFFFFPHTFWWKWLPYFKSHKITSCDLKT